MIRAGIVGGTGYTAGELLRLLLGHPSIEVDFVYSHSRPGEPVQAVHRDLLGQTSLRFTDEVNPEVDLLFLCLGHGHSRNFMDTHRFGGHTRVVDLSNEFRLRASASWNGMEFVYGLPELNASQIRGARAVANPGCFATAIQLALLPLAARDRLRDRIHVHAITGSTGAGGGLKDTSMFSWRLSNLSYYKPFVHQHLDEILEGLKKGGTGEADVLFLPLRGNFSRGIFATACLPVKEDVGELASWYEEFYRDAPFTYLSEDPLDLKQVVGTNHCFLHLHRHQDVLLVTSIIDNLCKGASGQAIENANLMFGLDRREGLHLKSIAF